MGYAKRGVLASLLRSGACKNGVLVRLPRRAACQCGVLARVLRSGACKKGMLARMPRRAACHRGVLARVLRRAAGLQASAMAWASKCMPRATSTKACGRRTGKMVPGGKNSCGKRKRGPCKEDLPFMVLEGEHDRARGSDDGCVVGMQRADAVSCCCWLTRSAPHPAMLRLGSCCTSGHAAPRVMLHLGSCCTSGHAAPQVMLHLKSCCTSSHAAPRVMLHLGSCCTSGHAAPRVMLRLGSCWAHTAGTCSLQVHVHCRYMFTCWAHTAGTCSHPAMNMMASGGTALCQARARSCGAAASATTATGRWGGLDVRPGRVLWSSSQPGDGRWQRRRLTDAGCCCRPAVMASSRTRRTAIAREHQRVACRACHGHRKRLAMNPVCTQMLSSTRLCASPDLSGLADAPPPLKDAVQHGWSTEGVKATSFPPQNGKPDGLGVLSLKDRTTYDGQWRAGVCCV